MSQSHTSFGNQSLIVLNHVSMSACQRRLITTNFTGTSSSGILLPPTCINLSIHQGGGKEMLISALRVNLLNLSYKQKLNFHPLLLLKCWNFLWCIACSALTVHDKLAQFQLLSSVELQVITVRQEQTMSCRSCCILGSSTHQLSSSHEGHPIRGNLAERVRSWNVNVLNDVFWVSCATLNLFCFWICVGHIFGWCWTPPLVAILWDLHRHGITSVTERSHILSK